MIEYLKSSREEIKKVTWPTRQQLIRDTLIVIGISIFLAVFLGGLDYLLSEGLKELLKLKK
ncbi:preprotein translocase subunit SecE [Candidatus Kaiserbacteria bacterium RIFCSPHIGHO2_01_FULL_48_10]|uniref:Protein translocase subunit SecE n=1 Tax=Candidatus Kaiserbacteria bacterium RIFCSPHIGHO2_01_FULL_48_10 TaxID=1798476 RepID=A0A1F6C316_9BACT|nr:MAG: preprotein translocase subunit SecE [Candidatus Kaiserbacteria bacterium RIFCSPHIGHO2_01_FULL_48_10]